jgi:DNA modification methylase
MHHIAPALANRAHPIDQLHPHPLNARRRNAHARAELRASLETNGQYRTVIARRLEDGTVQLLAGHGTVEQARELGWDQVAVDVHEQVSDGAAARIVAVDNRTSDLAEYDPEMEIRLLEEVERELGSLAGTAYSDADLAEMRANIIQAAGPAAFTDPDAEPDRPGAGDVVCQLGDVWELGPHRLVVGDGTDPGVVAAATGQDLADMLLVDPPYNVNYTGGTAERLSIANDHLEAPAFLEFLTCLFTAALVHTRLGGPAYVFHADVGEGMAFRQAFVVAGWELKQVLVWVKDRFVLGRQDHHWQHEPILYGWRPGAAHAWYGGRLLTTLLDDQLDPATMTKAQLVDLVNEALEHTTAIRADRPAANLDHPTKKPVALLERLIERSTRRGGLVLDTCAGSGSTLIAAHGTTRRAALVELDPAYADVICRRWHEHTGITPVLVQGDVRDPVAFAREEAVS